MLARPATPLTYAPRPLTPNPLALPTLARREAALDLGLVLLLTVAIPFGFEMAVAGFFSEGPRSGPFMPILIIRKWFDAVLALTLAAYFVYRHRLAPAAFGLQGERLAVQALWCFPTLAAVYAVFFASLVVIGLVVVMFPALQRDLAGRTEFLGLMPLHNLTYTALLLIPVAIHEELIFRGLLVPYLRRIGCRWPLAIFLSTTLFALLHLTQGWLGVVQVFGVGAVLGIMFVLTRSLTAVMLAHFLFDLIQFQIARLLFPWLEKMTQNA